MKKITLFFFILIISLPLYSQIKFEKGYFIDNEGKKTDCLIKNVDWKDNPQNFKYKLQEGGVILDVNTTSTQEFSILNASKYVRFKVKIDRSTGNLQRMKKGRTPEWNEETLFLKVLVEGKANLYYYEEDNARKFFYTTESTTIQQLVHKFYLSPRGEKATNNDYKQQLKTTINCMKLSAYTFEKMKYTHKKLTNYFIQYNNCENVEVTTYSGIKNKSKKKLVYFKIKTGANFSSLSIDAPSNGLRKVDFGSQVNLKFGAEIEYIFPFNKNKWALFIESSFQSFSANKTYDVYLTLTIPTHQKATVNYTYIDIPIGLRHYMFLNDNSSIFINMAYVSRFSYSSVQFEVGNNLLINDRSKFLALGTGYRLDNKWSVEFRHNLINRITLDSYTKYNTSSIILGYTLF